MRDHRRESPADPSTAAHIRGVAEGGRHELPNGLLRSVILRHPAVLLTGASPYV